MRGGFTLIELLVVVLIIGVLSAIALPKYMRAVEKANAHQNLALLKTLASFAEEYKLVHGTYPNRFDQLDTELPAYTQVKNNECQLAVSPNGGAYSFSTDPSVIAQIGKYQVVLNTTMPGDTLSVASARKSAEYGCYGFFYSINQHRFFCAEHLGLNGEHRFCAEVMGLHSTDASSWLKYNM